MKSQNWIDSAVEDCVAVIALNRAPVNAVDHSTITIHAALRQVDADSDRGFAPETAATWHHLGDPWSRAIHASWHQPSQPCPGYGPALPAD